MSAYTASFGQTRTCFAAAKSAAPGRVARKVGQVVTQITVVCQPAESYLPPRMRIRDPLWLQAVAFRAPLLGNLVGTASRSSFAGVSPRCATMQRLSQRKSAVVTQAKVMLRSCRTRSVTHAHKPLCRKLLIICKRGFVQVGDSLEEFLLGATEDAKLRQLMMSMSEAIRTIAFKVRSLTFALSCNCTNSGDA